MSDSYQQLPVQTNLNALAQNRALAAIQQTGRALPARVTAVNGSIVTVAFEATGPWTLPSLTLPKAESQWLRSPTQVGDFGMTTPAHTSLGYISGLGSDVADLTIDYGNMTTLVWVPCAAVSFPTAPDPNKAWTNGPAGAVVSDTAQTASMTAAENLITLGGPTTEHVSRVVRSGITNAQGDLLMQNSANLTTDHLTTSSTLIESDRVEGTKVYDTTGKHIGAAKRLVIEKVSGRVVYAIVAFGGFLGMGTDEYTLPWSALRYDTQLGGFATTITPDQLRDSPDIGRNNRADLWADRSNESTLHDYYGSPHYWTE